MLCKSQELQQRWSYDCQGRHSSTEGKTMQWVMSRDAILIYSFELHIEAHYNNYSNQDQKLKERAILAKLKEEDKVPKGSIHRPSSCVGRTSFWFTILSLIALFFSAFFASVKCNEKNGVWELFQTRVSLCLHLFTSMIFMCFVSDDCAVSIMISIMLPAVAYSAFLVVWLWYLFVSTSTNFNGWFRFLFDWFL